MENNQDGLKAVLQEKDCVGVPANEEYQEYLVDYLLDENFFENELADYCVFPIGYNQSIVYIKSKNPLTGDDRRFRYDTVPNTGRNRLNSVPNSGPNPSDSVKHPADNGLDRIDSYADNGFNRIPNIGRKVFDAAPKSRPPASNARPCRFYAAHDVSDTRPHGFEELDHGHYNSCYKTVPNNGRKAGDSLPQGAEEVGDALPG